MHHASSSIRRLVGFLLTALFCLCIVRADPPPPKPYFEERAQLFFQEHKEKPTKPQLEEFLKTDGLTQSKPAFDEIWRRAEALSRAWALTKDDKIPAFEKLYQEFLNDQSTTPASAAPVPASASKPVLSGGDKTRYEQLEKDAAVWEMHVQAHEASLKAATEKRQAAEQAVSAAGDDKTKKAEANAKVADLKQVEEHEKSDTAKVQRKLSITRAEMQVILDRTAADTLAKLSAENPSLVPSWAAAKRELAQDSNTVEGLKQLDHLAAGRLPDAEQRPKHLYFQFGTRLVSPYSITTQETTADTATPNDPAGTKHHIISSSSPNLRTYLEFGYAWAWVTEPSAITNEFPDATQPSSRWDPAFWQHWDVQARTSFQFGTSGTKANADTIMGSGDVNTEVSIGKPLWFGVDGDDGAWTVGLEATIGGNTDRLARTIHVNYFGGLAMNLGMGGTAVPTETAAQRLTFLHFGIGGAFVDHIVYVHGSNSEIQYEGDIPRYKSSSMALAGEAELRYPIPQGGTLTVGARLYAKLKPSPWVLYFGYTLDPTAILGSFINPEKK